MNHLFFNSVSNPSFPKLFSGSWSRIYHILYIYICPWYKILYCLSDLSSLTEPISVTRAKDLTDTCSCFKFDFFLHQEVNIYSYSQLYSFSHNERQLSFRYCSILQHRNFLIYNEISFLKSLLFSQYLKSMSTQNKGVDLVKMVQGMAMNVIWGMEHLFCENRLRDLELLSLEKRRLQGDLTAAFQCPKGACEREEDGQFIQAGPEAMVNWDKTGLD